MRQTLSLLEFALARDRRIAQAPFSLAFAIVIAIVWPASSHSAAPVSRSIHLISEQGRTEVSKDELWNHPLTTTEMVQFPGYYKNRKIRARVLPLRDWLDSLKFPVLPGNEISLRSLDGFQVPLSFELLGRVSGPGPIAYLAIEPSEADVNNKFDRWPVIEKGPGRGATAGPLALVWKGAQVQKVGPEQWPYQVVELQVVGSVESRFPMTAPGSTAAPEVKSGYSVFQKNCISCHSLNLQGGAHIGPDLNWPQSPIDYFKPAQLRSFLRNPSSLRHWENSSMPGFSVDVIPDSELDALLAYFSHMASIRPKQLPKVPQGSKQK